MNLESIFLLQTFVLVFYPDMYQYFIVRSNHAKQVQKNQWDNKYMIMVLYYSVSAKTVS